MKLIFTFLVFNLLIVSGYSQKVSSRVYDAKGIEQLYIDTDEVYQINIKTSKTDNITLTSHAEGEYFNDISLIMEVEKDKMVLTSAFNKALQGGFDKLSAHKVFSLGLSLEIPEGLEVFIESNIATVIGSGKYKNLQIQLQSGYCELNPFLGNATVNTYKGAIHITTNNARVDAKTRNGNMIIAEDLSGNFQIKLISIDGDISVLKN